MNEKILRDMAGQHCVPCTSFSGSCISPSYIAHPTVVCSDTGALTVADMEALFKPVPFGESHVSPLMQATAPDVLPIWDLFRNIDEDKQNRTLQVISSSIC